MRGSIKVVYIATFFGYLFKSVIFHDHTGGNDQFLESSKGYLIYNAVRKFKYVAVYKQLCEKSTMKFNLNPSSTSIISNFVTFPNEKKLINNNFDLNNLEILVVGNFRKQKNQDFLILLSHELKKKNNIKFCFHLIGEIQKKTYYLNFINRVKKDKLSSHFKIYNNNNNIFNFDKGINLALMPSIEESGPLVLIEYLILNIPFLAHDVGDVTNIIKKYIPNQVINNLDAKEWVERLLEVNFDDNLAKYSNIYIREFSKEIAYEKWLNAYKSVVV
jgi:glycosyltransferase involved in cell wall biosynthesis